MSVKTTYPIEHNIVVNTDRETILLEGGQWKKAFDGIRAGFFIVEKEGDGRAKIVGSYGGGVRESMGEITPLESEVLVDIEAPFDATSLDAGEWDLEVPNVDTRLVQYLPSSFQNHEWLQWLLDNAENSLIKEILDASNRLKLRQPEDLDDETLSLLLANLGSFIDTSSWTRDEKIRLAQEISRFYEMSGTQGYLAFLSYVRNVVLNPSVLWTEDHQTFYEEGDIPEDDDRGDYYLTNRIRLTYDFENLMVLNLDADDIEALFYKIAPIHDVLDSFTTVSRAVLQGNERIVESKQLIMSAHFVGEGG